MWRKLLIHMSAEVRLSYCCPLFLRNTYFSLLLLLSFKWMFECSLDPFICKQRSTSFVSFFFFFNIHFCSFSWQAFLVIAKPNCVPSLTTCIEHSFLYPSSPRGIYMFLHANHLRIALCLLTLHPLRTLSHIYLK